MAITTFTQLEACSARENFTWPCVTPVGKNRSADAIGSWTR